MTVSMYPKIDINLHTQLHRLVRVDIGVGRSSTNTNLRSVGYETVQWFVVESNRLTPAVTILVNNYLRLMCLNSSHGFVLNFVSKERHGRELNAIAMAFLRHRNKRRCQCRNELPRMRNRSDETMSSHSSKSNQYIN